MLGYLSEDEYEEIGKKMASNFAGNRKEVYKIFGKVSAHDQAHDRRTPL